eukprot:TRINITY_DN1095_c0_g1_i1.p1 TRINITY_DN1095_c0_g1~~TRINITY_DN1095_c0_g1_i1.p1  ORF type:complete len:643 (+),score=263.75 TRINITY_DN1095_c0_g1_i1:57-1985(+)
MPASKLLLVLSLVWGLSECSSGVSRFLSPKETEHMKDDVFGSVLSSDLSSSTRQSLHYAIAGSKLLGSLSSAKKEALCSVLAAKIPSAKDVMQLYDLAVPVGLLGCSLSPESLVEAKKVIAAAEQSTPSSLFHAYFSSKGLGLPSPLSAESLEKALSAGMKVDNSLSNLGFAFHLAGEETALPKKVVPAYYAWIEDAISQADEVDGRLLQFEGGLSATNFILSGILKLCSRVNKAPPMTEETWLKFIQYFMNRKSVQSVKGAYNLLEGITQLSNNAFFEPTALSLASSGVISDDSPKIRIRVSDLFGRPLTGKFDVSIESVKPKDPKGSPLLKGTKMAPVAGEASLFEVDMKSQKPNRGFYTLLINVAGEASGKKYIGLKGVSFPIKVASTLAIEKFTYSVGDGDQTSSKTPLKVPEKLPSSLKLEARQKLNLKFTLKDKETSGPLLAHQVFIRFFKEKSEIIYMAEAESSSTYKFEFNVATKAGDFNEDSGRYGVELILGDVLISNPLSWALGEVNIAFSGNKAGDSAPKRGLLPEIHHLFREPEKRPPGLVSNAFCILCLAPILLMFIAWAKIGVNVSGFHFSLATIGFHLGLGAIFLLYFYFWLKLNMFTTVKYLIAVGLFTFVSGNSMLAQIAKKKKV